MTKLLPYAQNSYYINAHYLGLTRVLYCVVIISFIGLPSYTWLGGALDYFFSPPTASLARIFHGFPGYPFFYALTLLNVIFFFLMFLGFHARWTSLLFSLTSILGHNFWYSFGKIDHLLLWIIAPIFLGFAGWGDHFSVESLSKRPPKLTDHNSQHNNSLLIFLLAMTIGFSMFTAGVQKLLSGWPNWHSEAVRFHLIKNYFSLDREELLSSWFLHIHNHILWKVMDYSALLLELGFLFSIIHVRIFRSFIAVAVVFHFIVLLMYNIPFYSNIIAYMIFTDWEILDPRAKIPRLIDNVKAYNSVIKIVVMISLVFFCYWCVFLINHAGSLSLPGFFESVFNAFDISDGYKFSLYLLFLSSMVFLILMCFFKVRRKYSSREVPT
ncbi:hypothetical protein FHS68_004150 [Dyadobacter arcticus]|uniref:HTTM domain-containing protein n=1 Tax=Dyadobacter arcticus TaxID=1078754 RepID=A0ABX0UPP1_9BACT|nr:hypothetical protein [Dyadobacter arcticus]